MQGEPMIERSRMKFGRRIGALLLLFLGALTAAPAGRQSPPNYQQSAPNPMGQRQQNIFDSPFDQDAGFAQRRLRALNEARQKDLVADTGKLVKLAQGLDADVRSSDTPALTPAQNEKLAEIEKLARRVRQKMTESVAEGPSLRREVSPLDR